MYVLLLNFLNQCRVNEVICEESLGIDISRINRNQRNCIFFTAYLFVRKVRYFVQSSIEIWLISNVGGAGGNFDFVMNLMTRPNFKTGSPYKFGGLRSANFVEIRNLWSDGSQKAG